MAKKKEAAGKKKSAPKVKKVAVKKAPVKKRAAVKKAVTAKSKKVVKSKTVSNRLVDAVVEGIREVKGNNISILDLRKIKNRVCDYYIICNAESGTQVKALADSVEVMVKKATGENPYRSEGFQNAEWILIDYVTVVAHIFQTEARYFYNIEALWADAEITRIDN